MSDLAKRLDEFAERQGIVSAEFCKLVDRVENLESENATLRERIGNGDGIDFALETLVELAGLREALNNINDLAPAMHPYSELEYGMVMIAREALKEGNI